MGRVGLCLVIMFFICSAQKIDAQVQNIREKQDTISATKSLEHIRPENIKKGPLNNALDVLSGQSAGVNVTTNGTYRLAMLNSIRVRGTTSIMGGNDPLVIKADILRFESANDRYARLQQHFPEITRRAPLTMIASYLQMTLETLSRVRASIANAESK